MAEDIVTGVRQAVQDFLAPEIKELRGELKRIEQKLDIKLDAIVDTMNARFNALDEKLDFNNRLTKLETAQQQQSKAS
jgi:predicted nuclease with TOPRIM domain